MSVYCGSGSAAKQFALVSFHSYCNLVREVPLLSLFYRWGNEPKSFEVDPEGGSRGSPAWRFSSSGGTWSAVVRRLLRVSRFSGTYPHPANVRADPRVRMCGPQPWGLPKLGQPQEALPVLSQSFPMPPTPHNQAWAWPVYRVTSPREQIPKNQHRFQTVYCFTFYWSKRQIVWCFILTKLLISLKPPKNLCLFFHCPFHLSFTYP